MSDEHQDDRLDELLREAALNYNRPLETPRDLMWQRIEARRRDAGAGRGARDIATAGVFPLRPRAHRQWLRAGVGIAAALALGFGLGRWNRDTAPDAGRSKSDRTPSTAVATRAPAALPHSAGTDSVPAAALVPDSAATPVRAPVGPSEQRVAQHETPTSRESATTERPAPSDTRLAPRAPSPAYTLAAIQHLTQAEALLTSFRAEARGGKQADAQLSAWAKDLLVSTRLMLDSPAGSDPRMRRLLEDLELVLAQIAQLSGQRAADELNLIDEAVEGRNVLPRLRTTIPAGVRPVGS